MSFTYRRQLTAANGDFEIFTNFPALVIIDDTSGAYPGLDTYDAISFHDSDGTRLSWECAEFNAGAKSYYFVKCLNIAATNTDYIEVYYGGDTSTEDKTGVWDANYVSAYHMKDETTSTILDSTSNNVDLTKKGANEPIEAAGSIGLAQSFDTNDYITVLADGTGTFNKQTFTLEFVFTTPAILANWHHLWSYDFTSHAVPYYAQHLRYGSGAYLYFGFNDAGVAKSLTGTTIAANTTYYATITYTNGSQEMWINAVSKDTDTLAGGITYYAQETWIGKTNFGTTRAEVINEVRFSDIVRSDNYIAAQDKMLRTQDYWTVGEQVKRKRIYSPTTVLIKGRL